MYTTVNNIIYLYQIIYYIQMYQESELGKEAKFLGRVTTLGEDRYIITVPKEDNGIIKELKGKRVFVIVRDARED